ncbi:MAG: glycosyltransferase family 4 protein [Bacteroidetes bacterium]|jgi:glycosyltransferase involved in cell wall biosynthesis|nr:glycosyltransferase family 4 protein [Bacteroidota bacterium]
MAVKTNIFKILLQHKIKKIAMALIAVNTRMLLPGKLDGTGWFACETLKRITREHPEHRFIFFFDRKFSDEFIFSSNITPVVFPPQARHPWLWYLWFEQSLNYALNKYQPDIFFSPENFICTRSAIPQVSVIHDLNFEHFPEYLPAKVARYYQQWTRKTATVASRLATVSEFSKQDIAKTYAVDENKIDVLYNGIHELYKPVDDNTKKEICRQYTDGNPFLIYVGSLHHRKNAAAMVRAFSMFKKKTGSEIKFLFVSDKNKMESGLKDAIAESDYKNDILFTGRLNAEQLAVVMASAHAMMYVSLFEGFGIPLIEAMRCHVPVITSDTTCLPEIADDAACLVNPKDENAIASAIEKVISDNDYRNNLIEKGNVRQQFFSWDKTAACTWNCISAVLK